MPATLLFQPSINISPNKLKNSLRPMVNSYLSGGFDISKQIWPALYQGYPERSSNHSNFNDPSLGLFNPFDEESSVSISDILSAYRTQRSRILQIVFRINSKEENILNDYEYYWKILNDFKIDVNNVKIHMCEWPRKNIYVF